MTADEIIGRVRRWGKPSLVRLIVQIRSVRSSRTAFRIGIGLTE
jgi:hypothetical protein